MRITLIDKTNLDAFSSLLYEAERERIAAGGRVIALGLCFEETDENGEVSSETAIGVLTGNFQDDDVFLINNLFVAPDYRQLGGASMLLSALWVELPDDVSVEVELYETAENADEIETMKQFLAAVGFSTYHSDDTLYAMTIADACSVFAPLMGKGIKQAKSFAEYSDRDIRSAGNLAAQKNLPVPVGGFLSAGIDKELSSLSFADGVLNGYIIVDMAQGGQPTISGLYTGKNPMVIGELFMGTMGRMKKRYSDADEIMLPVISSSGETLLKNKFPMARKVSNRYCLYR